MTTSSTTDLPTELPAGPARVDIEPLHLSITQHWVHGSSHNIHLLENGDIAVIVAKGQSGRSGHGIPWHDVAGFVVVALGVDDDHDEVHYTGCGSLDTDEVLTQAVEALVASRYAMKESSR